MRASDAGEADGADAATSAAADDGDESAAARPAPRRLSPKQRKALTKEVPPCRLLPHNLRLC